MKKQSITAISKRVFTLILAAFILGATSQKIYALPNQPATANSAVSYKGLKDNKLAFNVNFKNEKAEAFQLIVQNEQHEMIYSQYYPGKPLNTMFLFADLPDRSKLTFLIRAGKKEVSQSFEINTQVKTVEEYLVKGI